MVCAAAIISGAGMLLFSRNDESSLAWFAQPRQSTKMEVAIESSGSKAGVMPATVKPPTVTSESPNQQPSPEELAELAKRGRALLIAETASRGPAAEVQAVASTPPVEITNRNSPIGSQVAKQDEAKASQQDEAIASPPPAPPLSLENPEIPATSGEGRPGPVISRDPLQRDDAVQVQRRLIELGYLSGNANGKWGPRSKRALLEYKENSGLDKNDLWDAATERSLFSDGATRAVGTLPFVGGWSLKLGECGKPGQPSPVRITAKRAETSGGACEFNSIRPDGGGAWLIEAKCSAKDSSHVAHIRLAVDGNVLHWTSEQPEVLYYRCSR